MVEERHVTIVAVEEPTKKREPKRRKERKRNPVENVDWEMPFDALLVLISVCPPSNLVKNQFCWILRMISNYATMQAKTKTEWHGYRTETEKWC